MALTTVVKKVEGRALPLPGKDIDTDRIIPARYLKFITFEGLGPYAFYDERYEENGNKKKHPFNDPAYSGAEVLLAGENFGCGSSREHAPQALHRAGIKAIIGESFAEIFAGNCNAIGVPTVSCSHESLQKLISEVQKDPSIRVEVDIEAKQVRTSTNMTISFDMPEGYRKGLLDGSWDTTAVLLANKEAIERTASRLPQLRQIEGGPRGRPPPS